MSWTQAATNIGWEKCKSCITSWDVTVVAVNTTMATLPAFVYRSWTHSFALYPAYELLMCLEYAMTLGSVFPWLLKARHLHGRQEKIRKLVYLQRNMHQNYFRNANMFEKDNNLCFPNFLYYFGRVLKNRTLPGFIWTH